MTLSVIVQYTSGRTAKDGLARWKSQDKKNDAALSYDGHEKTLSSNIVTAVYPYVTDNSDYNGNKLLSPRQATIVTTFSLYKHFQTISDTTNPASRR